MSLVNGNLEVVKVLGKENEKISMANLEQACVKQQELENQRGAIYVLWKGLIYIGKVNKTERGKFVRRNRPESFVLGLSEAFHSRLESPLVLKSSFTMFETYHLPLHQN